MRRRRAVERGLERSAIDRVVGRFVRPLLADRRHLTRAQLADDLLPDLRDAAATSCAAIVSSASPPFFWSSSWHDRQYSLTTARWRAGGADDRRGRSGACACNDHPKQAAATSDATPAETAAAPLRARRQISSRPATARSAVAPDSLRRAGSQASGHLRAGASLVESAYCLEATPARRPVGGSGWGCRGRPGSGLGRRGHGSMKGRLQRVVRPVRRYPRRVPVAAPLGRVHRVGGRQPRHRHGGRDRGARPAQRGAAPAVPGRHRSGPPGSRLGERELRPARLLAAHVLARRLPGTAGGPAQRPGPGGVQLRRRVRRRARRAAAARDRGVAQLLRRAGRPARARADVRRRRCRHQRSRRRRRPCRLDPRARRRPERHRPLDTGRRRIRADRGSCPAVLCGGRSHAARQRPLDERRARS